MTTYLHPATIDGQVYLAPLDPPPPVVVVDPPTVTDITVTFDALSVLLGTQQFYAQVNGTNSPSQAVTWQTTLGSISSTGLLSVTLLGVVQTGTVTATSVADPTISGSVQFSIAAREEEPVTSTTLVKMRFLTPDGEPVVGGDVTIQLKAADSADTESAILMPRPLELQTNDLGELDVSLLACDTLYYVTVYDSVSEAGLNYRFYVPESASPVRLQDIIIDKELSSSFDETALQVIVDAKAEAVNASLAAQQEIAQASQDAVDAMNATVAQASTTTIAATTAARDIAVTAANDAVAAKTQVQQLSDAATAAADTATAAASTASNAVTQLQKGVVLPEAYYIAGEPDATKMLQRAIDALNAAGGGELLITKEYLVSASAAPDLFWFASVTAKQKASDVTCLVQRSGVTLRGINPHISKITSTDPTRTVICGVSMDGGGVRNIHVRSTWNPGTNGSGHGILLGIAELGDSNKNLVFEAIEISNVGSYGIGAQWGNFKNNRYNKIYVHDVGADAIDHKVRGGAGMVQATSRGVSFSDILVEKYGQRAGIVNSAGIDVRGPATVVNFHARNFGAAGGTNVGIRFSAGIYTDATGADNREPSSNSTLAGFRIESDPAYSTSGVVLLSSEGTTVVGGSIKGTTAFGVSIENSGSGYGVSRDNCIQDVRVEGVRSGTAFRSVAGAEMAAFMGCRSRGEYTEFSALRGNLVAGQTAFTAGYDVATVQVLKNGVALVSGTDYTATDGATVTLVSAVLGTDTIAVVTPNAKGWDIGGKYNQITDCAATFTTTIETISASAADTLRKYGNEFGFNGYRSVENTATPRMEVFGPTTDLDYRVDAKGTGAFEARSNGARALRALNAATGAVNWLQVAGSLTGAPIILSFQGSDSNGNLVMRSKGTGYTALQDATGNNKVAANTTGIGFYGTAPVAKPSITGSWAGNAAGASLAAALATLGLLTNNTTA